MTDRRLRVLHIDSAREFRGGQNQVRILMAGLAEHPDVYQALVASSGSELAMCADEMGVPVHPVRWRAAMQPAALRGIGNVLSGKWDIVHVHDSHALQLGLLALSGTGNPAGLIASRRVHFATRRPGIWRRAVRIIAVSNCIREVLARQRIARSRIDVVYDGIPEGDVIPQQPGRLLAAASADSHAVLVGAVGALDAHKDHANFVRAAALVVGKHPDVRFAVFGEGPLRESLEARIIEAGLSGRFILAGQVAGAARSLADLDVFVMPSRTEGLGTACVEAMLAGVPIVATAAGGIPELAGDAFTPVEPGNAEALAAEIVSLLDDPARRVEAGRRSRARASQFSAEAMVAGTLTSYARAVGGGG